MRPIPTLLRCAEHEALARITLEGTVVDLGGDTHAAYRAYIRGGRRFVTVNMDPRTSPDIVHDLEMALPVPDASYDHALLINVLEHIYHAPQLLREAARIVRPGGTAVIIVPFLFPIHADPHDYWRFSRETLEKMCAESGLAISAIQPLGTGVFAARYVMLDRLMPYPLRFLGFYTTRHLVRVLDACFVRVARMLGKKYEPADYALGYCVHAVKATSV